METDDPIMTRAEFLARHGATFESLELVRERADPCRGNGDFNRAAKQMGVWANGRCAIGEDHPAFPLLPDIAMFEPNERGVSAFDRFLSGPARYLPEDAAAMAQRMARARYSLFKSPGRHDIGGVWLEDLLDGGRRIWLADLKLEKQDLDGKVFGLRVVDAGPFHVGLGILVVTSAKIADVCNDAIQRTGRHPFPDCLAGALFGLSYVAANRGNPAVIRYGIRMMTALAASSLLAAGTDDEPGKS